MRTIQSQSIKKPLTHIINGKEPFQIYDKIVKDGFQFPDRNTPMLFKPPKVVWISMNYDWERWCRGESFLDIDKCVIADVKLKRNLKFAYVKNINDVINLTRYIMPKGYDPIKDNDFYIKYPKYIDRCSGINMMDLSSIMYWFLKKGIDFTKVNIWENVEDEFDGILYLNSWSTHMDSYFNAWDCDSIALFNPKDMELLNPRLGKGIG